MRWVAVLVVVAVGCGSEDPAPPDRPWSSGGSSGAGGSGGAATDAPVTRTPEEELGAPCSLASDCSALWDLFVERGIQGRDAMPVCYVGPYRCTFTCESAVTGTYSQSRGQLCLDLGGACSTPETGQPCWPVQP